MAAILAIAPANRAKLACRLWIGQVGSINKPGTAHVGASLLAKAVCHSAAMLRVMTSSRAGSFPQVGVFVTGIEDV
jgi:hypothetical protein